MRKRLIGFVILATLLVAGQALAADSAFNWNGFYAGLNVGGAWTSNSVNVNTPTGSFGFGAPNLDASGVVGGGQIGYNWQCGWWLLGIETDFQGSSLNKTVTAAGAINPRTSAFASFGESLDWFGTLRGRAGWVATPRLLIYGTGGFAYGDVENGAFAAIAPGPGASVSSSSVRTGWTAGGGVEWALYGCWTVKVEYLFMDLGSRSFAIGVPAFANVELDQNTQMVRAGVNFKF
jgi:outer membrane immunogenic protein